MNKKFTKLIAALALLVFMTPSLAGWGQTNDYTIGFKDAGTSYDGSNARTTISDIISSGDGYVSSLTDCSRVYNASTGNGVKLGASGGVGGFTMNLSTDGQKQATKITIKAKQYSTSEKDVKITINGSTSTTIDCNSSMAEYDWTLSSATELTSIRIEANTKRIYVHSVKVTYATGSSSTFTVTYNKNGDDVTGTVPTDATQYNATNNTVTVLDNINLEKPGNDWSGWCLNAAGTGTVYGPDYTTTYTISANTTFYAKWTAHTHDVTMPDDDEYGSYIASEDTDVPYGTTVTLTYEPNSGYENYDATWTVNGTAISGNTFSMPDEDVTVGVTLTNYVKDQVDIDFAGVSSGSYTAWNGKTGTSGAIYAGRTAGSLTVTPKYIQLNKSTDSSAGAYHSGIITTGTGGKIKKVVVTWATKYSNTNGRYLTIYGKNTSYEATSDLYDSSKRGTELGSITYSSSSSSTTASLTISGDYKFVGLLTNGAMYFDKIDIYWEPSNDPSITASDVDITYDATGGNIAYAITNPVDGATLQATVASGATIGNFTLGTVGASPITFTCDANSETTAKTATVTLNYVKNNETLATKSVTITQEAAPLIYTTIPAIFEAATSTETTVTINFNNWVISAVNGKNAFLTDNAGNGLIIYEDGHGFAVNNILSGTASCTLVKYKGSAELKGLTTSTTGLTVTSNGTVTPQNIAINNLTGVNTGALLSYTDLTYDGTNLVDGNSNSIKPYTTLYSYTFASDKTYNVTGIYQQFDSTKELMPRSAADIEEVATPALSADDVNIGYNATSGTITYTLENSVSGGVLTAAITAGNDGNWLTVGEVAANVPFTCSVNDGTARTATVRLTYTYNTNETVTEDVIVTQAAAPIPALYTYSVNGVEGETFDGTVGGEITLATGSNLNQEYTFAGWTTDPTDVSIRLTGNYTIAQEVTTFYAVYAHATSATPDRYVKVTSLDDIVAGEYIIVSDGYYLQNDEVTAKNGFPCDGKTVTIVNDEISNVTSDMLWTFTGTNTAMSIKSGNFVLYNVNDNNGMRNTTNNYAGTWSFSNNGTGFKMIYSSTSRYCGIYANAGVNTNWRSYSAIGNYVDNGKLYLYKKQAGSAGTTNYYTRIYDAATTTIDNIPATSVVTVPNGVTLTLTGTNNGDASNLIIEDGGQLITDYAVQATVKKTISGHESKSSNAGWNFIASPITGNVSPSYVTNMLSGEYDLYRFNQSAELEWENFKNTLAHNTATNPFLLVNGKGYLYANSAATDLSFAGTMSTDGVVSLVYDSEADLAGWNLVGNPFPCKATIDYSCYTIQDENNQQVIKAATNNYTIAPCEGVMVKASTSGQTITFTKVTPEQGASQPQQLQITLTQEVTTRGNAKASYEDNAIVSFNEGSQLEKFYFGEGNANIYIPQDGKEYAIAVSETQGEMPVNFKAAEDGSYTLTVNPENVEMRYLHLIDNLTGANIDLLQTPSYTFNASVMDYASRFRLVFCTGSAFEDENGDNVTFAYYNGSEWVLASEGEATLQVVDMMGRVLSSETVNGNASVKVNAPAGVYVLRLVNGEKVMTQKIVVR